MLNQIDQFIRQSSFRTTLSQINILDQITTTTTICISQLITQLQQHQPKLSGMLLARNIIRQLRTITTQTTFLSGNRLLYRFAETSRDIEQKMRQQKMKSLQNKFKALDSSFGLNRPASISSDYPKPSSIEYSLQSLRKCSHMYPQYLLKELNNKSSQYYQVIQKLINNLGVVDNKQAIQFLQFLSEWKLYLQKQDYAEVIKRKIYQMKLDLNQLFTVIKFVVKLEDQAVRGMILQDIEAKILDNIIQIEQHQYQSLFKLLNFMRMHDLAPRVKPEQMEKANKDQTEEEKESAAQIDDNSFYKVVQNLLLRNLDNIPLPSLVQMIVHYANNVKEQQDDRINIMSKVEPKVIQNLPFFNHDELIAIVYSYVKTNTHTQKLINEFVTRIELLFFQVSWENKKKILNMASSFPTNKWMYVVGISIFQVLKGKKVINREGQSEVNPNAKEVEFQLLPTIYLSSYETNLATPELIQKLQSRILQQFFNYSAQDIGLIAWLFTITPPSLIDSKHNKDLLYTRLQAIIQGGFNGSTFTLKDISMIVWSMCNIGGKSNAIYKQNAKFWNNIQDYIQDRIANNKEQRLLNGCCQILWAYTNNKPLTMKTVSMIMDIIIVKQTKNELQDELFIFELTTITSFFYPLKHTLPKSINQFFHKLAVKYTQLLVQEMDYHEIMKMLKCIIYDDEMKLQQKRISLELWEKIVDQFVLFADRIEYQSIMGVIGFTIVSPQGRQPTAKAVELVKKLMANKQKMEQLKSTQSRSKA